VNVRVITASAGSGKTYRLTAELENAIAAGRARPEGIVATTFTKQAAAELIERARTRLLQAGRGQQAHQLLASRIGTVNAVCGALVSEFAFELGMSPDLRILDEGTSELEFHRALARVVTSDVSDEVGSLAAWFEQDFDWRQEVRRIVDAARANGMAANDLRACGELSVRDLDACMGRVPLPRSLRDRTRRRRRPITSSSCVRAQATWRADGCDGAGGRSSRAASLRRNRERTQWRSSRSPYDISRIRVCGRRCTR
jgi:ATP-dependent helicase/nuclease subunit A